MAFPFSSAFGSGLSLPPPHLAPSIEAFELSANEPHGLPPNVMAAQGMLSGSARPRPPRPTLRYKNNHTTNSNRGNRMVAL